ncbi:MAG: amino acid ABC transporter ATP-binding protein [Treponemataceae bacterium]
MEKQDKKQAIIQVRDIQKSFKDLHILKGISFDVHKGEVLSIIGPSGSGKSTMLRCICQLETVDSGSITICSKNLVTEGVYAPKKDLQEITLKTGLVFQNFNLFPHYSVLKNVTDPQITVLKKSKEEAIEVALNILKRMDLYDKANSFPYQLSGGQQQRVSIARSLALKPAVLLFDEPTSALDPELTGEILKVIRSLASEHMTMVVVTHEISFARDLSDEIIFMSDGLIVEQGHPCQIINNPQQERTKAFLSRF